VFVNFNILNQLGSPAINSNTFANRPAAGQTGRLFVSTDTFELYRDNGTTYDLIGGPGSSTITGSGTATQVAFFSSASALTSSANLFFDNTNNRLGVGTAAPTHTIEANGDILAEAIYLDGATAGNGALYWTSDRVTVANYNSGGIVRIETDAGANAATFGSDLTATFVSGIGTKGYTGSTSYGGIFNGSIGVNTATPTVALDVVGKSLFTQTETYSTGVVRTNTFDANITVAAGGSFSSPNAITALGATLDLTLQGSATIPSGARSGLDAYNSVSFTGTGTLTHNQGGQIRAYSNLTTGWTFAGSATGTITHLAGLHVLFPDNTGSAVTITNNYALLLNDQTANTGTVTYTNRFGIYQEGSSDLNYMAANLLLGSTTNSGEKLQVTGTAIVSSSLTAASFIPSLSTIPTNGLYLPAANTLGFATNSTERMRLDASGNLGLGVSPSAWRSTDKVLQINNSSLYDESGSDLWLGLNFYENTSGTYIYTNTGFATAYRQQTGQHNWFTAARGGAGNAISFTQAMTLNASGNLGLGVTPSAWTTGNNVRAIQMNGGSFLVYDASSVWVGQNMHITAALGNTYTANGAASAYIQTGGAHIWNIAPSGTAGNAISFTQAMSLFSTGNLAIGTTTDGGQKLQVNGKGSFKDTINLAASTTTTVGTTATTISTSPNTYGGLAIVWGDYIGNIWTNLIFYSLGTVVVLASQDVSGGPDGRTYTVDGSGNLKLAMAANTYTVRFQALITA